MTATCPVCGRSDCRASEKFMQATRTEPMLSLGFSGYCPSCDLSFRVAAPQLVIGEEPRR